MYYENVRFKCMCVSDFVSRLPFCIALVAMSVLLIYSQYLYVTAYSPERTKQLRIMLEQCVWNNKWKYQEIKGKFSLLPFFCCRGFVVVVCSCSSWLCAHERKQKENNVRSIKANYSHQKLKERYLITH